MSVVSLYVVDLRKVQPLSSTSGRISSEYPKSASRQTSSSSHHRRSFSKADSKTEMKVDSDPSGTDDQAEDSDSPVPVLASKANNYTDITDVAGYENIFRPRARELTRTPPFEAPSGSESESALIPNPTVVRPGNLRIGNSKSPTRRASQPSNPVHHHHHHHQSPGSRIRRISASDTPNRNQRSTSVQPRSSNDLVMNPGDASPPTQDIHHSQRAQSLSRTTTTTAAATATSSNSFTALTPVSRIQIGGSQGPPDRPLDRPTLVRPNRTSLQHEPMQSTPVQLPQQQQYIPQQQVVQLPQQQQQHQQRRVATVKPEISHFGSPKQHQQQQQQQQQQLSSGHQESSKFEVIPMNADKPSGISTQEFLPKKFQDSMTLVDPAESVSKFSAYSKHFQTNSDMSETEVTSSILKGHESMMAVLATRGRNIEILRQMWVNKDAKAAVDQAVCLNDQAVLVDLLSVITFRPSIWNLDLCTALLPPIGELLQSKYEMYINVGCGAMKLILKNFASVIKSNIDSPVGTAGVDISREERHNKCMQCYKDLVKIRSLILKRQTMQGKLGHTYRELSILMQYLD